MNKKGFINQLSPLAMGIISVAIIIALGLVVLSAFATQQGGLVNSTLITIMGYLGTSNGGLAKRKLAHKRGISYEKAELRLKPRNRQDRDVTSKAYLLYDYVRTTDNANPNGLIYSLTSNYNLK